MYRTALQLSVAIAITAFTALPAAAQQSASPWQNPGFQQSGSAQPQPTRFAEDFDGDPVSGWDYSCPHAFVPAGNGRALATQGGGHAIWVAAGKVSDFSMKLRYGYEQGIGDVFFRLTNTPSGHEFYCLKLQPNQVVLARRMHAADKKFPEKKLAAAAVSLSPRGWHEVIIQAKGGQIRVWLDGQGVLQVQDPQPLRSGLCGLGAIANSGYVLYDQVTLVPEAQPNHGSSGANLANWP